MDHDLVMVDHDFIMVLCCQLKEGMQLHMDCDYAASHDGRHGARGSDTITYKAPAGLQKGEVRVVCGRR